MESITDGREPPEPTMVLRTGSVDAAALVVLWLARRSFWALAWTGVIVVALSGTFGDVDDLEALDTPRIESAADARDAVRSPQALLVLAPAVRLGSGWLALALAYPLARRLQQHADRETRRGGWHPAVWSDRWYLVRALRDWRWTSSVRRLARQRLGRAGPPLFVLDIVLLVTGIVLLPVAVAVLVANLPPLA